MATVRQFQTKSGAGAFPDEMLHAADWLRVPSAGSHLADFLQQRTGDILHLFLPKQMRISSFSFWTAGNAYEHVSEWFCKCTRVQVSPFLWLPGKFQSFGAAHGIHPPRAWGS